MIADKIVYLADDDHDDRSMVKEALENADPDVYVIEAQNGLEVLVNIQDAQDLFNSVVIVDMRMPVRNGLEVIRILRATDRCTQLPIIMMTSSNDEDLKIEAIKAGANGFITKPISMDTLPIIAVDIIKLFFN
jgi:CheY-like chemotaxis protein